MPQGSVLGPVLFLIYINDLPDAISHDINLVMFTDDIKINSSLQSDENCKSLQTALDKILDWSKRWQLKLSISKCNILHLGKNNKQYMYRINQCNLEKTTSCRDLGVKISDDDKFSLHIREIEKNAYFKVWQIYQFFASKNIYCC